MHAHGGMVPVFATTHGEWLGKLSIVGWEGPILDMEG